jgi:hypothetical protein
MADFVSFDKDLLNSYSIYEALEFKENNIDNTYYCLCGSPLFIKNESIKFLNKNGIIIQRHAHFSHYKNCLCNVKKVFDKTKINNTFKISDAPKNTELTKRISIIHKILSIYKKSYYNYFKYNDDVSNIINTAKKYKIDINEFNDVMDDNVKKLINIRPIGIGFKEIEFKQIEQNIIYYIVDLFLDEDVKKFGVISYSLLYRICDDFERYKRFVKNLSLIAMFASRCINFHHIKSSKDYFIIKATEKITQIRLL